MERLMHYIWQHRLWPAADMTTVDGRRVTVIDPGRYNTDAGPDFFNAKLRIGTEMWAGDVEIHVRASDWHRHGHHNDAAYDSVILHVVDKDDAPVRRRSDGNVVPQLRMPCSPNFRAHYDTLTSAAMNALPCADTIASMQPLHLNAWLDALAYERLYRKTARIMAHLDSFAGDWESVCYVTLARALGFGVNSEPFERLAQSLPLRVIGKHSDSQLAVEALLFGQSGLLQQVAVHDAYTELLMREYEYLSGKFGLKPLVSPGWKMSRMRPANFPHRRIALLAALLFGGFKLMSRILSVESVADAERLWQVELAGYWSNHYTFGGAADTTRTSPLGRSSITLLCINVVAPLLLAYGQHVDSTSLTDRAVTLLHDMRPESNSVVTHFTSRGVNCPHAFASQALIELRREYCEPRKCLYCRIGHRMLSQCVRRHEH